MWSRIVFWLRLGAAVFAGVAAVLGVYNYYATQENKLPLWVEPAIWGVSLGIIMFDNVGTLVSRKIHAVRGDRQRRIEKSLMSLIIRLSKDHGIPFDELGASVYVPSRIDLMMRRPLHQVRLKRIIRYRPTGFPQQSGVAWTPQKGKVGESWRMKSTRYLNSHKIAAKYRSTELTQAQFGRISESTRGGFSRQEFMSIIGKYSEIAAEPIWHGGKERTMLGVLSIDRAYIDEDDKFSPKLDKKTTREVSAAVASTVSDILKPSAEAA